jgi:hypothetical protein
MAIMYCNEIDRINREASRRRQGFVREAATRLAASPPAPKRKRQWKRAAPKPPVKDKVKQRAGIQGAMTRWANDLEWHREWEGRNLDRMAGLPWRRKLYHTMFRWLFLWHAHGQPTQFSPPDRGELRNLMSRLGLEHVSAQRIVTLACITSSDGGQPWRDVLWRRSTIRYYLGAAEELESEKMKAQKAQSELQPSPSAEKRGERRKQTELALSVLRKRGDARPSLRTIQAELLRRTGRTVSLRTIAQDLGQRR